MPQRPLRPLLSGLLAALCSLGLHTHVHANGLANSLGSQVGGSAGAASALGGLLGGGNGASAALSAAGLTGSSSAGNAAGVLTYCMKNNYLSADKASAVKEQLQGKVGLGTPKEEPQDAGYLSGLAGQITGQDGKTFSLDQLKGDLKDKACDFVLDNAQSLL